MPWRRLTAELTIGPREQRRARRVWLLLIAIILCSIVDLLATATHVQSIGMVEANPVGLYVMEAGCMTTLVLFKFGSLGVAVGLMLLLRHRVAGEVGCWILITIMLALMVHWKHYNETMSEELVNVSYDELPKVMKVSVVAGEVTPP